MPKSTKPSDKVKLEIFNSNNEKIQELKTDEVKIVAEPGDLNVPS